MVVIVGKTKSMLICSKQRQHTLSEADSLNAYFNDTKLKNTQQEKLLGVRIDSNLTWKEQIDYVCKIVSTRLALLRRIKQFIDIPTRILFFNGYILPFFNYCNLVWSSCTRSNIMRIEKLLKSAARIILDATYDERSEDLFNKLGWKTFLQSLKEKRLIMVFKSLNGHTPSYMRDMFKYTHSVHDHGLRSTSSQTLYISGGRTDFNNKRFSYIGAKEWNDLPNNIKSATTLNRFKALIKEIL